MDLFEHPVFKHVFGVVVCAILIGALWAGMGAFFPDPLRPAARLALTANLGAVIIYAVDATFLFGWFDRLLEFFGGGGGGDDGHDGDIPVTRFGDSGPM